MVGGVVFTTMVKRELEDCEIGRQGDRGTLGAQWHNGNNQREEKGEETPVSLEIENSSKGKVNEMKER